MKHLSVFINESIYAGILKESLQSPILIQFFSGSKNNIISCHPAPMLVINSMKWSEMTDEDVSIISPEDAYHKIYSHSSDSDELMVWSLNNGYMVASVGKDIVTNIPNFEYRTIRSMYNSGEVKEVLEVKDWKKFDSSFLRELRRQQKSSSKLLNNDLSIADKTEDYYNNIFKDKDISLFSDVVEKTRSVVREYKEFVSYISQHKSDIGKVWTYKLSGKFTDIYNDIEEMMLMIVEIQPGVDSSSTKDRIMDKGKSIMNKISRFKVVIEELVD